MFPTLIRQSIFKRLFGEAGAKDVVTIFHAPQNAASTRILTLLKQSQATAQTTATEDQASSHDTQSKAERTEFELDVQEGEPTSDQLRTILEYMGSDSAGKIITGAVSEEDAVKKFKSSPSAFVRPLVVDWNAGRAVVGENESEILRLVKEIPRDGSSK
ncbi:uncharacterized protein K452DRAFT_260659 [Aplosporella prunicola CBS 121167]|uniref:Thioredoxin-like fold domain-containing protein n=1 Tax=Aplosporella prunicola CBS 121167 TaxID=1176127 RepID=A0A6A6AU21_9PEZI|nr:uncharacterized protein K452DRAFT_260659 [Aplosporella prunicola CBS 121167]KAF2135449.1 hypothetical protein K452DRAFT_260659 [Aplosporella prunicola CBS 121167]